MRRWSSDHIRGHPTPSGTVSGGPHEPHGDYSGSDYQERALLRIDERVGTIEKGKLADLSIVDGDPLADIKAMRNIKRVMLNGVWIEE